MSTSVTTNMQELPREVRYDSIEPWSYFRYGSCLYLLAVIEAKESGPHGEKRKARAPINITNGRCKEGKFDPGEMVLPVEYVDIQYGIKE